MDSSDERTQQNDTPSETGDILRLWAMVEVQTRTWPGINKPGGIGRVTRLHSKQQDGTRTVTHVDVHYVVLGCREKCVPVQFVKPRPDYDTDKRAMGGGAPQRRSNLRDRSMLLGRCKRCGSLRRDCGSCDWRIQEQHLQEGRFEEETNTKPRNSRRSRSKRGDRVNRLFQQTEFDSSSSSSSSSSDESLQDLYRKRSHFWKYQRERKYFLRTIASSNSDDSDKQRNPLLPRRANVSTPREEKSDRQRNYARNRLKRQKQIRPLRTGLSTLERLGDPTLELDADVPQSPSQTVSYSTSPAVSTQSLKSPSLQQDSGFVENVGESDLSPTQPRRRVDEPHDTPSTNTSTNTSTNNELRELASPQLNTGYVDDDGFIQPEGQEVAENLPQDTQDKTSSLCYGELPAFFDRMVAQLEECLPNAQRKVQNLLERLHRTEEGQGELEEIQVESSRLYSELMQSVIRDTLDQCVNAMRRLRNKKERRKHKERLTREQAAQCGESALTTRDLRIDLIGGQAEEIMRDLRRILVKTESRNTLSQASDFEDDMDFSVGSREVSKNASNIGGPISRFSDSSDGDGDFRPLAAFDPHRHATKARRENGRKRQKKSSRRLEGTRRKRKLPRSAFDDDGHSHGTEGEVRHSRKQKRAASRPRPRQRTTETAASGIEGSDGDVLSSDFESDSLHSSTNGNRQAPSLESILSSGDTVSARRSGFGNRVSGVGVGTTPKKAQAPIADRMQAFLDVNSSNIEGSQVMAAGQDRDRETQRQRRCPGSLPQIHASTRRPTQSSVDCTDDLAVQEEDGISAERLYHEMLQPSHRRTPPPRIRPRAGSREEIGDLCSELVDKCPHSPSLCWSALAKIHSCLERGVAISDEDASEVFKVILHLLQLQGCGTFQEILQEDLTSFRTHVLRMSYVLGLIEHKVNEKLRPEDGVVYNVFNPVGASPFVDTMMLQSLDVVYSQLLPTAWGLKTAPKTEVLGSLSPLRDALSRTIPVLESACLFITKKLLCQRWWKVEGPSQGFVSSINPDDHASFLMTGAGTASSAESTRFKFFKNSLPRCEIEAIWSIFAYFSKAILPPGTEIRWRLVQAVLFSKAGVLGSEGLAPSSGGMESLMAPSREQVLCCEKEIGYVNALLSVGAMDPLPSTDGFIVKLVEKAIILQCEEHRYNPQSRQILFPPMPTEDDFLLTMRIWGQTSPCKDWSDKSAKKVPFELKENFLIASNKVVFTLDNVYTLLPTSRITRLCVSLLVSWAGRIPQKKARLSRLNEKTQKLASNLEARALCFENRGISNDEEFQDDAKDSFQDAFRGRSSTKSSFQPDVVYREAASHLLIALATVAALNKESGALCVASFTTELREKVWDILSDKTMKKRRMQVIGSKEKEPSAYNGSALRLYSSAKALAMITFLHLGVPHLSVASDLSETYSSALCSAIDEDDNMLVYLVSGLVTCLDCACDLLSREHQRDTQSQFPVESLASEERMIIRIISCIALWLCRIFIRTMAILKLTAHQASKLRVPIEILRTRLLSTVTKVLMRSLKTIVDVKAPEAPVGMCLRACLAAIRSGLTFSVETGGSTNSASRGGETSLPQAPEGINNHTQRETTAERPPEDDYFGDLDDGAFVDIDLNNVQTSGENSRQVQTSVRPDSEDCDRDHVFAMFAFLSSCLDLAKPSKRYAILQQTRTSSMGRAVIARHAGGVCSCLAALCMFDLRDETNFESTLAPLVRPMNRVDCSTSRDDRQYMLQVAQCFSSELCHFANKSSSCARLVKDNMEDVFIHLVNVMLDVGALERFPSCNLQGIVSNGGVEGKAKRRLHRVNKAARAEASRRGMALPVANTMYPDIEAYGLRKKSNEAIDSPGPCYNSQHVWSFCRDLGTLMGREGESISSGENTSWGQAQIGRILLQSDSDLPHEIGEFIPLISLERECLKRLKKLRGIISAVHPRPRGAASTSHSRFECVSSVIFSSTASQALSCLEAIRYCRLSFDASEASGTNDRFAKLVAVQWSYAQVTVALFSWILRESCVPSESFSTTLRFVRDSFFARILQRDLDVQATLQQLVHVAVPGFLDKSQNAGSTFVSTNRDVYRPDDLLADTLNQGVLSRSKELMLHVALGYRPGEVVRTLCLYNALMTVGTSTTRAKVVESEAVCRSHTVGRAFFNCDSAETQQVLRRAPSSNCELHKAIDEYFTFVGASRVESMQEKRALQRMRHFSVKQFVVPKLGDARIELSKKMCTTNLLVHIIQSETAADVVVDGLDSIAGDSVLVCSVANAVSFCIRESMVEREVRNDMVGELLRSAKYLVSLRAASRDSATETRLSWSKSNYVPISLVAETSVSSDTVCATYIWTFALWLKGFCEVLAGPETDAVEFLRLFRLEALELKRRGNSIWAESCELQHVAQRFSAKFLSLSQQLNTLGAMLFSGKDNVMSVTNVYRKTRDAPAVANGAASNHQMLWTPDNEVLRASREFIALF